MQSMMMMTMVKELRQGWTEVSLRTQMTSFKRLLCNGAQIIILSKKKLRSKLILMPHLKLFQKLQRLLRQIVEIKIHLHLFQNLFNVQILQTKLRQSTWNKNWELMKMGTKEKNPNLGRNCRDRHLEAGELVMRILLRPKTKIWIISRLMILFTKVSKANWGPD